MENFAETDDGKTVNELLEIMHEHDLDTLKVKVGDAVFELVRRDKNAPVATMAYAPAPAPAAGGAPAPGGKAAPPADVKRVTAPLTGVFYRSSSPDSDAFVSEGSRVDAGAVVCILEAMKLFNEIQTDFGGTIVRIIPENGELVSQGEDLFWIGP